MIGEAQAKPDLFPKLRVLADRAESQPVQSGPEVDLVLTKQNGLFGFECKAADTPRWTPSMITAVNDLNLTKLFVIYPGEKHFPLGEKIEAVGFQNLSRIVPTVV